MHQRGYAFSSSTFSIRCLPKGFLAMFDWNRNSERNDASAQLAALHRSQAVIEFKLDGTIIAANENFLRAMGYSLAEVAGKHHRMFVDTSESSGTGYRDFWAKLSRGEYQAAEFRRLAKGGREIWIEASYNPVLGRDGKPYKVVKFAIDVTKRKAEIADLEGQVAASGKSQAVISFTRDGIVLEANDNFLKTLGYTLDEIKGKHHGMFVAPAYRAGAEYAEFWASLKRGEYQAGQYHRFGKGGREIWIQ